MKKRSLFKLILYFVLTLGFYELIWLAQTRKELVESYGAKIPRTAYIVATHLVGVVISLLLIHLAFLWLVPADNGPSAISSDCWSQYILSGAPEDVNSSATISSVCKQEINQFYQNDARQIQQFKEYGLIIVLGLFYILAYLRWFTYYASAVEKATRGKLSGLITMLLVVLLPYGVSMLLIQHVFNSQEGLPGSQQIDKAYQSVHQEAQNSDYVSKDSLRNVSMGIGIGVAILVLLIILFQILIAL